LSATRAQRDDIRRAVQIFPSVGNGAIRRKLNVMAGDRRACEAIGRRD
jgi:hypothetical protein